MEYREKGQEKHKKVLRFIEEEKGQQMRVIRNAFKLVILPTQDIRDIPQSHPNYYNYLVKWRQLEVWDKKDSQKNEDKKIMYKLVFKLPYENTLLQSSNFLDLQRVIIDIESYVNYMEQRTEDYILNLISSQQFTEENYNEIVQSDIKSQKLKTLLTNLARFALQNVINLPDYKDKVQEKSFEVNDLMKIGKFKKELLFHIYNQLIRAKYEHYVVVLGTEYMLQVKYSKGSMVKFDILGVIVLLYEVPYISVPTIRDNEQVFEKEFEKLDKSKIDEIIITVKQHQVNDSQFDGAKQMIEQGLKESLLWYQNTINKPKQIVQDKDNKDQKPRGDPRLDNLAGVLLSRFINKQSSYHWHILFSKIQEINSKSGRIITNHEIAIKRGEQLLKASTALKLGVFMRLKAQFKVGQRTKEVEVIVFNQKSNPQTSVQSLFLSGVKDFSFKKIFTANGMAVMAFLCLLIVFFMHKSLCAPTKEEVYAAISGEKLAPLSSSTHALDPDDVIQDPRELIEGSDQEGLIALLCNKRNDMIMNLGVIFLLLTVTRQFVIRYNAKADRVR
ncbi:UNKNOWN [Stylonychia lemnae]|uniref:Uncharacterized protein n=1 Tax=Stylonychia lemnae TaxID=5949 RepID=A0A078A8G2_STYLE|nr:UNKNOWN [Stylonychia lemnae]|eukprot:CDW78550.1 UNKNOWN [Stylonychia lemnae]